MEESTWLDRIRFWRRTGRAHKKGFWCKHWNGSARCDNGQMTTPSPDLFKGGHFDQEIIVLCVRWYLSFKLSARDLVQMMTERGIVLAHTTILRWVQRYVPEFEKAMGSLRSSG